MYFRKIRPSTTCLYSAASMLFRSASAACHSFASKPAVPPPLARPRAPSAATLAAGDGRSTRENLGIHPPTRTRAARCVLAGIRCHAPRSRQAVDRLLRPLPANPASYSLLVRATRTPVAPPEPASVLRCPLPRDWGTGAALSPASLLRPRLPSPRALARCRPPPRRQPRRLHQQRQR